MSSGKGSGAVERYWRSVKVVTALFFVGWLTIAVIIPALSPYAFRNVWVGNLPPLHWFMLTFVVIMLGVALIFSYAAVMDRLDSRLRSELKASREEEAVVRRGV